MIDFRLIPTLGLALVITAAACTSDRRSGPQRGTEASESAPTELKAEQKQQMRRDYDAEGRLLPSDEYVAGVRLPRGAELAREEGLVHVYRIQAPIDKVLAYFGPMLITGNVERRGKGAVYKRASVRGGEINPTKVDVSILEVGNSLTRISVTELPPPPEYVPSAEQTKAATRDSWRRLD